MILLLCQPKITFFRRHPLTDFKSTNLITSLEDFLERKDDRKNVDVKRELCAGSSNAIKTLSRRLQQHNNIKRVGINNRN